MHRILPATLLTTLWTAGCATAGPKALRPSVVPVADPALYECAQRTAYELGFRQQMRGESGRGDLVATTDTNRYTGRYDQLRVRILSDTGHVTTWITASPHTDVVNRPQGARPPTPSQRATDAASAVERECRPDRVAERGGRAPV